ncbi:MAG: hypothetical protein ACK5O8_11965 [Pirellula sp.]
MLFTTLSRFGMAHLHGFPPALHKWVVFLFQVRHSESTKVVMESAARRGDCLLASPGPNAGTF